MANCYSSESTQRELSNEYKYDRVTMIFMIFCALDESNLSISRVNTSEEETPESDEIYKIVLSSSLTIKCKKIDAELGMHL